MSKIHFSMACLLNPRLSGLQFNLTLALMLAISEAEQWGSGCRSKWISQGERTGVSCMLRMQNLAQSQ